MKKRLEKLARHDGFWALLLAGPTLLGIAVFNLLPIAGSFWLSLTRWNLLSDPRFIGLKNYRDLLSDSLFYQVLGQTFAFVGMVVAMELVGGILVAMALSSRIRGGKWLRTAYFLPFVTSMVAVSIVWGWVFDPANGALNMLLKALGAAPVAWLSDPVLALPALAVVTAWKGLGYAMMLVFAGLQAIPTQYDEAAQIDGASAVQRFFGVTLPLLSPTIFLVAVLSTINAFQAFDAVYLLTAGGPANRTTTIVYWLYQNAFVHYNLGKASAIAYVLFAVLLALTLVQWGVRKKWVYAE